MIDPKARDSAVVAVADAAFSPAAHRARAVRRAERPRPEKLVVADALTYLRGLSRSYAHKVHGGSFGNAGEPDIDACVDGRAAKLEAKAKGAKPTSIQIAALHRWQGAGALVGWFTDLDELTAILAHGDDPQFINDLASPGCGCARHQVIR
jgi:hypothetical protein